jgi:hypothetical protein
MKTVLTPIVKVRREKQSNESSETVAESIHVEKHRVNVYLRPSPFDNAVIDARPALTIVPDDEAYGLDLVGDIRAKDGKWERK